MSLHYATIIQVMKFCPIVFMFGPPGAGKTTALNMTLQVTGGICNRLVTNATRPAILSYCSQSPFPIGIDDPSSMSLLEALCVDLYNGAQKLSVSQGANIPQNNNDSGFELPNYQQSQVTYSTLTVCLYTTIVLFQCCDPI